MSRQDRSFEQEVADLDRIIQDLTTHDDLKKILIRINRLQRLVFEEIERRKNLGER